MQLQAIHRFAAANGKTFSNVALEEVEAAEGGVEKWNSISQKTAEEMYKAKQDRAFGKFDNDQSKPRVYPILEKRKQRSKGGSESSIQHPLMFCMLESSG